MPLGAGPLRRLDAGHGQKIPTLAEFLDLMEKHPKVWLNLELKDYPSELGDAAFDTCRRVLDEVEARGLRGRCIVNSFSAELHEYIRRTRREDWMRQVFWPLPRMEQCGAVTEDPYESAYCCCMCDAPFPYTKKACDSVRAYGVHPWTGPNVKDAVSVERAITCGIELCIANNPDVVLPLLRERGYHK